MTKTLEIIREAVKQLQPKMKKSAVENLKQDTDGLRANGPGRGIQESLPASATASDYIDDFVNSKNKKFDGDSKKQRIRRALGAWYAKKEGKK